jgi:DeoR family transcriptional regulator, aga operon transcriptional repressor
MDTTERRDRIESLLKERKEVNVSELNGMFNVSSVTIRNDLIYLERKGIAKRLFGKIVLKCDLSRSQYDSTAIVNLEEKERIGKFAAGLIRPDDSVLFYTGTTTQQIVRFIDPSISFIAVTNSVFIAEELMKYKGAKTIFIGGNLSSDIGATYGLQAIRQLQEYNIDKSFLAVDGVDADLGITNRQPFEGDINRVILERSSKVIVVADHSKIGNVSFVPMGDISEIDMIITDAKAPAEQIERIRAKGVQVEIA